ncbi:TetR/AcrR family transcriptional regulator [Mycobacterium sp. 94-17]|uniref:TetR/AcrR family transcriptional regulator n=1 Tax=Mycobacterium sp. 94-17 TaxID=2986147 RepID=UPI002D1F732C|nr:TetR family transcriptional regulator [Mycobacterium sp. 94-17]MEB4209732.1 TetR family transcriptional regulator [Mycobacterium sp. 94-17]
MTQPGTSAEGKLADVPGYKLARRAQIVRAALDGLRDNEYDQIQMRDVAESADVALGTLYRYFTSKEHIYAAVLLQWAQPVVGSAENDTRPAELRIRTKMRGIIASFERRPQFFKVVIALQNANDVNAQEIMAQFARVAVQSLAEDFAAMGQTGASDAALMLWGIVNTMLTEATLRRHPIAEVYRIADAFIDMVATRLPADQRH